MPVEKKRSKRRHGILVLGMHRSGASTLAGILGHMGGDLPEGSAPDDAQGRSGSRKIRAMNDAILASAGSSWDDWQGVNPDWVSSPFGEVFLEQGRKILDEEYGNSGLFVVEDSRICRLIPFWKRLLKASGVRPLYVNIHRNPMEVATVLSRAALDRRESWPFDYGLLLWTHHVLDAEIRTRGRARFFTSYDRVLNDWAGVVAALGKHGRIVFPRRAERVGSRIDAYLAAEPHFDSEDTQGSASSTFVSQWIDPVLRILEGWAESGENPEDYRALDRIRIGFDAAGPLFGSLVETMRDEASDGVRLRADHDRVLADMQIERSTWGEKITALETERDALRRQVKDIADEKWQVQSELSQRKAQIEDTDGRNRENDDLIVQLTAETERLKKERDDIRKSARMERVSMQNDLQKHVVDAMITHRKQSDTEVAKARSELHALQVALKATETMAHEREDLIKSLAEHQARVAALEEGNAMILNSTSWKLTAPVRRLVGLLKR